MCDMNSEQFRDLWPDALRQAKLSSFGPGATETLDLASMSRVWQVYAVRYAWREIGNFIITAELKWKWSALETARSVTAEEDALMQFAGRRSSPARTDPRWIRVDVILHASHPWGQPFVKSGQDVWQRWVPAVNKWLEPALPRYVERARAKGVVRWTGLSRQ
jgi:hypothetical protein